MDSLEEKSVNIQDPFHLWILHPKQQNDDLYGFIEKKVNLGTKKNVPKKRGSAGMMLLNGRGANNKVKFDDFWKSTWLINNGL